MWLLWEGLYGSTILQGTTSEALPQDSSQSRLGCCAARARVSTETTPQDHDLVLPARYPNIVKRTFVLRLSPEAYPVSGKFEGRVEEVDSGRSLKFRSIEEFLDFLQKCLDDHQPLTD
jgi:hypothetical protein